VEIVKCDASCAAIRGAVAWRSRSIGGRSKLLKVERLRLTFGQSLRRPHREVEESPWPAALAWDTRLRHVADADVWDCVPLSRCPRVPPIKRAAFAMRSRSCFSGSAGGRTRSGRHFNKCDSADTKSKVKINHRAYVRGAYASLFDGARQSAMRARLDGHGLEPFTMFSCIVPMNLMK
jgi:hypothetical protein